MKLMILDGNSVINRAYFGVKPLTTREGLYTNAIYGFLNIFEKMQREEQPDAVCVAFDLHGPTFRHLRYDGYKATRHGMDEELAMQMPINNRINAIFFKNIGKSRTFTLNVKWWKVNKCHKLIPFLK